MENVSLKSDGLKLETDYYQGSIDLGALILHGFTSNKDRKRLRAIAKLLNDMKCHVLAVNFQGSGNSDSAPVTVASEIKHARNAIKFLKKKCSRLIIIGESLGALVALESVDESVCSLILLAPVTDKHESKILTERKKELEENGFIIHHKESDDRYFELPRAYFDERMAVNQKELLSKITCPVLILHGTADKTIDIEKSRRGIHYLSKDSRLREIVGGSHKLDESLEIVLKEIRDWIHGSDGI